MPAKPYYKMYRENVILLTVSYLWACSMAYPTSQTCSFEFPLNATKSMVRLPLPEGTVIEEFTVNFFIKVYDADSVKRYPWSAILDYDGQETRSQYFATFRGSDVEEHCEEWIQVTQFWKASTGKSYIFVNGSRTYFGNTHWTKPIGLPYGLTLGQREFTPKWTKKSNRFTGVISRFMFWDHVLKDSQMTELLSGKTDLSFDTGLVPTDELLFNGALAHDENSDKCFHQSQPRIPWSCRFCFVCPEDALEPSIRLNPEGDNVHNEHSRRRRQESEPAFTVDFQVSYDYPYQWSVVTATTNKANLILGAAYGRLGKQYIYDFRNEPLTANAGGFIRFTIVWTSATQIAKTYINGVLKTETTITLEADQTSSDVGAIVDDCNWQMGGGGFAGRVCDLQMWDYALDDAQLHLLFHDQLILPGNVFGNPPPETTWTLFNGAQATKFPDQPSMIGENDD